LFLLSRGWPCPRFFITAPVSRSITPVSAIRRSAWQAGNPGRDLEGEDDTAEEICGTGIRVFPDETRGPYL
jgi:hypothetical protein